MDFQQFFFTLKFFPIACHKNDQKKHAFSTFFFYNVFSTKIQNIFFSKVVNIEAWLDKVTTHTSLLFFLFFNLSS